MQKTAIGFVFIWIVIQGCSTLKRTELFEKAERPSGGSMSDVIDNNISNHSFYIQKADITVAENNSSTRFFAIIKYKMPDSLMISFRARLGFEAARILITKDTLIISDRINKKARIGKPEELGNKYGIEPGLIFAILGDIIIDGKDKSNRIKCNQGLFTKDFRVGERQLSYTVDCKKEKVISTSLTGDSKTGSLKLEFSSFFCLGKIAVPGLISAKSDMSNLWFRMKVEKAEIDYKGNIGFRSPSNYKIVELK
jgi:hypothetical protein